MHCKALQRLTTMLQSSGHGESELRATSVLTTVDEPRREREVCGKQAGTGANFA